MPKLILRLSIIGVALGLGLTGCGSDKSNKAATTDTSASSANPVSLPGTVNQPKTGDATSGSIEVELDDFYFGPSFIKATPGATVTVHLSNEGKNRHTFTSTALGIDKTLSPDEKMDVTVTMPATGASEFHCSFHQSQGMQGAFFFKEGDAVAGATPGSSGSAGSSGTTTTSGYYN